MTTNEPNLEDNGLTRNHVRLEVGKAYNIDHTRKGKWRAICLSHNDTWAYFDDDDGQVPIRLCLFSVTSVE